MPSEHVDVMNMQLGSIVLSIS